MAWLELTDPNNLKKIYVNMNNVIGILPYGSDGSTLLTTVPLKEGATTIRVEESPDAITGLLSLSGETVTFG